MILQLVEEKKLSLSDHLSRFFPEIPNAEKITINQILYHRSGIPDIVEEPSFRTGHKTHEEVLAVIAKGSSRFEPDTKTEYSNTGYVLLGYILEKIDHRPYAEVLQTRIIRKIGLRQTYLGLGNTDTSKNEALSYRYMGGWKEAHEMDLSVPGGAGAILSTPTDMALFIQGLFDGKLVSAKSLEMMKTFRDEEGLGIIAFDFAGRTQYGYTGGSIASGSWLAYDPAEKLAIGYTTNAKIYPVREIIAGVFDIYFNRPFDIPALSAYEVSPELLDQYTGIYTVAGAPVKMIVTRKDATLYIQAGNSTVPLEPVSAHKFKIDPGVNFEFDLVKRTLTIKRPQGERVFTREN